MVLLKSFLTKSIYDQYFQYLDLDYVKEENKELYKLYLVLQTLQESGSEQESFSVEDLQLAFHSAYPILKKDVLEACELLFERLRSVDISEVVLSELLRKYKERSLSKEFAVRFIEVTEGRAEFASVVAEVEASKGVASVGEVTQFVTDDLETLYEETVQKQGLRWRTRELNEMLGSLRKGDFGFVFARPETGKTTFLASEVSFMATQALGPIVHFNNEEQGNKVMLRYYQAALGLDWHQLRANLAGNREKYHEITKSNIRLYDSASIHRSDVERVCQELQPSLIIFDQLDKIRGFDADRQDLVFGKIYQWARELAKTYGPVIAVSQASASGEGKRWLSLEDIDGSKTAKAAEADWILGIGKTHAEEDEYTRFFHAVKNKLQGDEDSIPDLRHGRVAAVINPQIARYGSIGEA